MQEIIPTYDVIKTQSSTPSVRLGLHPDVGEKMDEAVLRYQGIVNSLDLPPVQHSNRLVKRTVPRIVLTPPLDTMNEQHGF